jgi:hypothetical protein
VSPKCIYGNKDNISAIVLGDSHANASITAIQASLDKKQSGALFMGADGRFPLIHTSTPIFKNVIYKSGSVLNRYRFSCSVFVS